MIQRPACNWIPAASLPPKKKRGYKVSTAQMSGTFLQSNGPRLLFLIITTTTTKKKLLTKKHHLFLEITKTG